MNFDNENLYVSGGMTGLPNFNFDTFDDVEEDLYRHRAGHVYSPAEHDRVVIRDLFGPTARPEDFDGYAVGDITRYFDAVTKGGQFTLENMLVWDLNCIINDCDGIVMLPGWEKSTGAKYERMVAEAIGKRIYLAVSDHHGGWDYELDEEALRLTRTLKGAMDFLVPPVMASNRIGLQPTPTPVMERWPLAAAGEDVVWSGAAAHMPGARPESGMLPPPRPTDALQAILDAHPSPREQSVRDGIAERAHALPTSKLGGLHRIGHDEDPMPNRTLHDTDAAGNEIEGSYYETRAPGGGLPTDRQARKEVPMARGCLDYFPDALAEVSHVSFIANEQHNPGEPMHWAKEKSTDEADALLRHLVDRGTIDSDGLRHSAKVAWRALALLQRELDNQPTTN